MEATILAVVVACLGSTGLFTLVGQIIHNRREKSDKKDTLRKEVADIQKTVRRLEKDGCRTQLLVMMRDYPLERAEIMALGEHYFADLDGNWYMSSIFSAWLKENGIAVPDWFKEDKK